MDSYILWLQIKIYFTIIDSGFSHGNSGILYFIYHKKIEVNNFKLVKSTLTPKGSIYEVLEVFEKIKASSKK